MDYFDFFHPPFSSLATIVANGLSVNQILLRRSPPAAVRIRPEGQLPGMGGTGHLTSKLDGLRP